LSNGQAVVSNNPFFGCIGCGHCMAICPTGAIEIHGREISSDYLFDLPASTSASTYDQLLHLLQRRRSSRELKDTPVDKESINKILEAAKTAPMGLPPSDVNVLIFDSKDKVRAFAKDYCDYLEGMKWLVSKWFLALMRPFWGKSYDEMFKGFVRPVFRIYVENMRKDINFVNYDAPLMMYFYGSPYADPADPIIAATYAMLAAESLGLGTCMLGGIHPLIQSGKRARKFRESYGIKYPSREGLFVIFGYPDVQYKKGIRRSFASVTNYK
ncbi:MAG: nitroreductase family protein, partial [Bacteroidales bacterium]|nr:nitroreductase family protein [Bacteroidales bacterium]